MKKQPKMKRGRTAAEQRHELKMMRLRRTWLGKLEKQEFRQALHNLFDEVTR